MSKDKNKVDETDTYMHKLMLILSRSLKKFSQEAIKTAKTERAERAINLACNLLKSPEVITWVEEYLPPKDFPGPIDAFIALLFRTAPESLEEMTTSDLFDLLENFLKTEGALESVQEIYGQIISLESESSLLREVDLESIPEEIMRVLLRSRKLLRQEHVKDEKTEEEK